MKKIIILFSFLLACFISSYSYAQTQLSETQSKKAIKLLYKKMKHQQYEDALFNYDFYEQLNRDNLSSKLAKKLAYLDTTLPAKKAIFEENKKAVNFAKISLDSSKTRKEYKAFLRLNLNESNAYYETIKSYYFYAKDTAEAHEKISESMSLIAYFYKNRNTLDSATNAKYFKAIEYHKRNKYLAWDIYKKDKNIYYKSLYLYLQNIAQQNDKKAENLLLLYQNNHTKELLVALKDTSSFLFMETDTLNVAAWIYKNWTKLQGNYPNLLSNKYQSAVQNMLAELRRQKRQETEAILTNVNALLKKGGKKNVAQAEKLLITCSQDNHLFFTPQQHADIVEKMQAVAQANGQYYVMGNAATPMRLQNIEDILNLGTLLYHVPSGADKAARKVVKIGNNINAIKRGVKAGQSIYNAGSGIIKAGKTFGSIF
ncbi:hypothetical protein SAMN05421780_110117 [Flexibacter flexilis DSM 6793]|uniref:Uncharacterized protein n=1 Tax=Flexibacter flexilis DSM 6793 TaxID=927664 RepID=A0A1I1MBI7_9BACT|nr:hypothetical protein [Flexibacter flexilis]SFC82797.1 hypothetical protein SAMN05421780_110117 [Flexibacter flexilis DSM 6793]